MGLTAPCAWKGRYSKNIQHKHSVYPLDHIYRHIHRWHPCAFDLIFISFGPLPDAMGVPFCRSVRSVCECTAVAGFGRLRLDASSCLKCEEINKILGDAHAHQQCQHDAHLVSCYCSFCSKLCAEKFNQRA
ncbi:hypothetical protein DAI22_03g016600 [Oryza sativa Japonica Group]|nr:hypothetical protein DAI22_03g016600 [Oryza sativa Japonica Group]